MPFRATHERALPLAIVLVLASLPGVAAADTSGSLPAAYEGEDDGWLKLAYDPSTRGRVHDMVPRLAEMRAELRAALGTEVLSELEIRVAASDAELAHLGPDESDDAATHKGGASFTAEHLVLLSAGPSLDGTPRDLESGARYHLARLALAEATVRPEAVPPWFAEGFATNFSHEGEGARATEIMVSNALHRLPHVADLERPTYAPDQDDTRAAFAAEVARFLGEADNGQALPEALARVRAGETFDIAVGTAIRGDMGTLDRAFRRNIAKRYALVPVLFLSALLWALLAAAGWVRRRRQARSSRAASRFLEARPVRAIRVESVPRPDALEGIDLPRAASREGEVSRKRAIDVEAKRAPADIDVPVIEHDDGWHTLH